MGFFDFLKQPDINKGVMGEPRGEGQTLALAP